MATILQHYQKVTSSEGKASCPQQLVAVAKQWSTHMVDLVTTYMPYPCVVISNPEDAALYGNVQQVCLNDLQNVRWVLHDKLFCFHWYELTETKVSVLLLQLILMSSESSKILELLGTLDSSPDVGQKTLIITNSAQEVENVFVVKQLLIIKNYYTFNFKLSVHC